jgi:hypothetical protein
VLSTIYDTWEDWTVRPCGTCLGTGEISPFSVRAYPSKYKEFVGRCLGTGRDPPIYMKGYS